MLLVKTSLLKKIGNSTNHWRQVTLLMSNNKEYFEIKTFYGRSMKSLQSKEIYKYDLTGMAYRDFETLVNNRINSGYEELELFCIPEEGLKLSAYEPPVYSEKPDESPTLLSGYVAMPIYWGRRVMIRIGCESIVSVDAICCTTKERINISDSVKLEICKSVKLGQFENGIFEALIGKNKVCFLDAAFVNGIHIKGGFVKRNLFLRSIIEESDSISVTEFTNEIEKINSIANPERDLAVRAYICKPEANEFSKSGDVDRDCFIMKNYYKAFAEVNKVKCNGSSYEITMLDKSGYVSIGTASSSAIKHALGDVVVYFTGINNGKLVNAWLGYEKSINGNTPSALISQLNNLPGLWQGNN